MRGGAKGCGQTPRERPNSVRRISRRDFFRTCHPHLLSRRPAGCGRAFRARGFVRWPRPQDLADAARRPCQERARLPSESSAAPAQGVAADRARRGGEAPFGAAGVRGTGRHADGAKQGGRGGELPAAEQGREWAVVSAALGIGPRSTAPVRSGRALREPGPAAGRFLQVSSWCFRSCEVVVLRMHEEPNTPCMGELSRCIPLTVGTKNSWWHFRAG